MSANLSTERQILVKYQFDNSVKYQFDDSVKYQFDDSVKYQVEQVGRICWDWGRRRWPGRHSGTKMA